MSASSQRLSRLRLGDILVTARLVSHEQLQEALALQAKTGGRLGDRLLELGHLSEPDLKRCLARQSEMPFEDRAELDVDLPTARLIPEELATRHRAIPMRMDTGMLVVALADPLNYRALDEIGLHTGRPVRGLVVTDSALQRALVRCYGIPDGEEKGASERGVYDVDRSDEGTVIRLVNSLCQQALNARASDIHIEPLEDRVRVRYRVDGALLESNPLPLSVHVGVLSRLKVMAGMDIAERRIPQDGQIQVRSNGRRYDLRVGTVPTVHGERAAIRILDRGGGLRTLDGLQMRAAELARYREMIRRPNGILLITGPTGSGKSTTLMATLSALNTADKHIITVEDPVEYRVPGVSQIQVNPKAGLTFASGLRSFLRQDPDVIMVGEIRDGETADIAIRAALTGHLVLSTLHTNQAAGAVSRLVEMGVEPFLLGSSLLGVVAQRLVRLLCTRCKESYTLSDEDPDRLLLGDNGPFYQARGCGFCEQTGYMGRQAIFEVLQVGRAARELIARRGTADEIQRRAIEAGMQTLWENGLSLVRAGVTTVDEIRRVAFAEEG